MVSQRSRVSWNPTPTLGGGGGGRVVRGLTSCKMFVVSLIFDFGLRVFRTKGHCFYPPRYL